ncbi:polysaccharide pyruvyl transferase CsaB [Paenibacillus oryzae]|uniref:Polysaccharide pyruvyl transferase CsaB n=1 Tax=Paenibacillus oryzae TaxID=1844972 RepID=A0A1A5YD80_9BACL|nr:polysaccharide pyruvyl transferase CsaB [Paenibacillus oryzae]OBR63576.1 polysaccharide pyruvyl transferase CsaB [Paenibacillus oryzae]
MGNAAVSTKIRLAISGYYGFNNSGDEAVLRSILLALEEQGQALGLEVEPIVLSADPAWTSKMYGVESAHRMRPAEVLRAIKSSHGLISGGGSLLQDATSTKTIPYYTGVMKLAQMLGKPTFAYAQGIGPVNRRWLYPMIAGVMNKSAYISVRDEESSSLLNRIGIPQDRIEVVPDPVMGLPLPKAEAMASAALSGSSGQLSAGQSAGSGNEAEMEISTETPQAGVPVVGVSLRRWRQDGADIARIAAALEALSQRRPVILRFLPFHKPSDRELSEELIAKLESRLGAGSSAELHDPGDDPQQMLLAVGRCQLLVGMRLHALIYAAGREVPLLGISYDPKIDQFLARLDLKPIGTTEDMHIEAFVAAACSLLDDADGWRSKHGETIQALRQQAQRPAQQILTMMRQYSSR